MSNFENYRTHPPEDASPKPLPYYDVTLPDNVKLQVNNINCLEFWFSGCPIKHVMVSILETASLVFYIYNAENSASIIVKFNNKEQFEALFNNYATTVFGFSIATVYAGEYYKNYFKE